MGHDIYAYKIDDFGLRERLWQKAFAPGDVAGERIRAYEQAVEVAYLRRSAGDPLNSVIYEALDAMDCYGGVSGHGKERRFSRARLEAAESLLAQRGGPDDERQFIKKAIAWLDQSGNDGVTIGFY